MPTLEERQAVLFVRTLTQDAEDPPAVLNAIIGAAISENRARVGSAETIDALGKLMAALGKQVN